MGFYEGRRYPVVDRNRPHPSEGQIVARLLFFKGIAQVGIAEFLICFQDI
jgi:hypothetical protein